MCLCVAERWLCGSLHTESWSHSCPWNSGFLSAVVSVPFLPLSPPPNLGPHKPEVPKLRAVIIPLCSPGQLVPPCQSQFPHFYKAGGGSLSRAVVGRSRVCPWLRPAGGSRGQQRAAQRGEERRWRATAGRDFKSPSFPPNPSFSSPPPGRRGGSFHLPLCALARPCSVSGDRQQPASKSLIISFFLSLFFFCLFLVEAEKE